MAITELIFPQVKTDKASIDEIEREWPSFEKMLTNPNPGLLSAFRGWVSTENEQDVRGEFKEILIFGKHPSDLTRTEIYVWYLCIQNGLASCPSMPSSPLSNLPTSSPHSTILSMALQYYNCTKRMTAPRPPRRHPWSRLFV